MKEDNILLFDTETAGLPKKYNTPISDLNNWPRVVSVAWLLYEDGKLSEECDFIIRPEGFVIPPDVARIHGITTEKALADGEDLSVVLRNFAGYLNLVGTVVGHNLGFDEKVIGAEFLRKNIQHTLNNKEKVCTMDKSTNFCAIPGRYGFKWPKLNELHIKLFGCSFENQHNALSDIRATAKCFWEMKRLKLIE